MIGQSGNSLRHIAFEGKPVIRLKPPRTGSGNASPVSCRIERKAPEAFIAWVLESAGLPAAAYRAIPMHRRLTACLRTLKAGNVSEARDCLIVHPELRTAAIDSLMIGVTEFFRDPAVFDVLREIISSSLVNRPEPVRIWSAGCSNGAELYSLAILLGEAGLLHRSVLVGTDCRATAIREAQAGIFCEAGVKFMDASLRKKYFRNTGGRWRIIDSLSRLVQWRVGNVLSGSESGPWDIILWRNMAIYLEPKPVLQLWSDLIQEMRPGGLLVVGKAERPPAASGLTCVSQCIYRL